MRYLLFMLPGLCHVGCARMAGQKYLIKMFLFGFRGERHGVLPGSSLCACLVSFLFFLLFPRSCVQQLCIDPVVTCYWIGRVILTYSRTSNFMLICLTWRWTKQRLYCSTPLEVQFEFSPRNLLTFFITATIS